jgi:hypothetical protein
LFSLFGYLHLVCLIRATTSPAFGCPYFLVLVWVDALRGVWLHIF